MLRLLARWLRRPPARRPRAQPAWLDGAPAANDEPVLGCGWFDSSHDLRAGLQMHEHATAGAVASELPLAAWLELHLADWRGLEPR